MSVSELIVTQILRSYQNLTFIKEIQPIAEYSDECIDNFEKCFEGPMKEVIKNLVKFNFDQNLQKRKLFLYQ